MRVALERGQQEDRLVVECDDPALSEALVDLYFACENDCFVKRFPRASVTAEILARFERALIPMLKQTARLEPVPWEEAVHETARRLDGAGVDWWLTGSGALAVRGVGVSPRDLDLVVTGADAARTAAAFEDALIEPAVETDGWFCRWFGRAWAAAHRVGRCRRRRTCAGKRISRNHILVQRPLGRSRR